ncbi:MAG: hypothetical protein K0R52_231 [Alphaproteobacteria bacterium]|nr:hypothetical protein [Alphaproteobacteria bacterium]
MCSLDKREAWFCRASLILPVFNCTPFGIFLSYIKKLSFERQKTHLRPIRSLALIEVVSHLKNLLEGS